MNLTESLAQHIHKEALPALRQRLITEAGLKLRSNDLHLSCTYHEPFGLVCFRFLHPEREGQFTLSVDDFGRVSEKLIVRLYREAMTAPLEDFTLEPL